jgi:hypothetical protein
MNWLLYLFLFLEMQRTIHIIQILTRNENEIYWKYFTFLYLKYVKSDLLMSTPHCHRKSEILFFQTCLNFSQVWWMYATFLHLLFFLHTAVTFIYSILHLKSLRPTPFLICSLCPSLVRVRSCTVKVVKVKFNFVL